jgi:membrane-associated protease RseP (regulator of RpoE activity)
MLNAWQIVVVWFIIYSVVAHIVSKKVDYENLDISGPFLTIHSQKGLELVEWLSNKFGRFWKIWGNLGILTAIASGAIGIILIGTSAYAVINSPSQVSIQGPTDALVIPGVNRFIPISATPELLMGLILGIIVHEGGHAIYCRTGDISIESTGLFLGGLIPLGAFVEPNEQEQWKADTGDQLRMYSAGIMNNFLVFIVTSILLLVVVTLFISPVSGLAVMNTFDDSVADDVGIERGDVITKANDVDIESFQEFRAYSSNNTIESVELKDGEVVEIPDGVFISKLPRDLDIKSGTTITSVDGTEVSGSSEFYEEMRSSDNFEVSLESKNSSSTVPVGAYLVSTDSRGISDSLGLSRGETTYVYEVGDERVYNAQNLRRAIEEAEHGEINITYGNIGNQEMSTYTVSDNRDALDTVSVSEPVSGIDISALGVRTYPKEIFYDIMSFDDTIMSTLYNVIPMMFLPVAELSLNLGTSFSGFAGSVSSFYTTSSSVPSWIIFVFSGTLLWTAWINFNLGLFNCLPTFALDGGHILKASVEEILDGVVSQDTQKYVFRAIQLLILVLILSVFLLPLII